MDDILPVDSLNVCTASLAQAPFASRKSNIVIFHID